jgi:hypothetical protein
MQISDEQLEDIKESWELIQALPSEFHRDARIWWNTKANPIVKDAIISATYYETMVFNVESDAIRVVRDA